jgi:hypothetical protein
VHTVYSVVCLQPSCSQALNKARDTYVLCACCGDAVHFMHRHVISHPPHTPPGALMMRPCFFMHTPVTNLVLCGFHTYKMAWSTCKVANVHHQTTLRHQTTLILRSSCLLAAAYN